MTAVNQNYATWAACEEAYDRLVDALDAAKKLRSEDDSMKWVESLIQVALDTLYAVMNQVESALDVGENAELVEAARSNLDAAQRLVNMVEEAAKNG